MRSRYFCAVLFASAVLPQGTASQPPRGNLVVVETVCCAGSFTLNNVLRKVRPTPEAQVPLGQLKLTIVRDRSWENVGFPGTSEDTWSICRNRLADYFLYSPPFAFILQSSAGASAVLSYPATDLYETKNIWGRDLLNLEDGSQLVYLRAKTNIEPLEGVGQLRVWVWAKGALDREKSARIHAETERLLGVPAKVTVGEHPLLWVECGGGFPHLLPAFGALGKGGIQNVQPGKVYDCYRTLRDGPSWCFERRPEH